MPLEKTTNIWHNGRMIGWDQAQIHVMSHVIHYGSSVFEGLRCYATPNGAGVFRLPEHMQRMLDSAKIYRMPIRYSLEELCSAVVDLVEANGVAPCYIRPIAFRGYGEVGVNPTKVPVEVYIVNYPWGKYVPGNDGADVCISSWNRLAPNTMPSLAKAGANYMNSQLIRMEAEINGYSEGIALDVNGYLSEGSGENLFLVRGGVLYTTPLANSVLNGITRASVLTIAKSLDIPIVEQPLPREMLYICDEAFFTGTAAEVTHLRSVDRILVGDGTWVPSPPPSTRNSSPSSTAPSPTASAGSPRPRPHRRTRRSLTLTDDPQRPVPAGKPHQRTNRRIAPFHACSRLGCRCFTRSIAQPLQRKINQERLAHNRGARNEAPVAAVLAVVAVVAQHEVAVRRHRQFAIRNQPPHLAPPARVHSRIGPVHARKIVAVAVRDRRPEDCVRLRKRLPIHISMAFAQPNPVARQAHHALHQVHRRVHRIVKDNQVAAVNAIRRAKWCGVPHRSAC